MATALPEILYRNILKESQDGRGSGEIMAYGTTAVVSGMTFDLTTLNARGDLTEANDVYIGMFLKFTSSGREYLITDYVAATDVVTVFETPDASDTTDWTIRRNLWTDDFDVATGYPVRNVVNGRLYEHWKDNGANSVVSIMVFAPNGVDDGGAEMNSISTYWQPVTYGGTTGGVTVNNTSPILGSYDFDFNLGDRTYIALRQPGKIDLKKGRTYGIIFKSKCDSGTVMDLNVFLYFLSAGDSTYVSVTFTKIDANDVIVDVGNGANNRWYPQITTTASWDEITFTVPEDIDAGDWGLRLQYDNPVDLNIDEIYIWEVIQPDTFAIFGHNMAGGFANASFIIAERCASDLTNRGASEYEYILDLDVNVQVDGKSTIYETFTATTSIYPVFKINLASASGKIWQAAEVWLGERWTWEKFISDGWKPYDGDIEVIVSTSAGGVSVIREKYRNRKLNGKIPSIGSDEYAKWLDFIDHSRLGKSFCFKHDGDPTLGPEAEILLMRNRTRPVIEIKDFNVAVEKFDFVEVK